jgi:predicted regulator of Ras-like GTPase activity (Roadblock/LC7/MglB family)
MTFPDQITHAATRIADGLLARIDRARAVVVSSEDGFRVACATRETMDTTRLAAITSSMTAIGETVSRETGLGTVRCLMVEADDGYLVMRATRHASVGLVVAALVAHDALLGLVIHGVAEAARELAL